MIKSNFKKVIIILLLIPLLESCKKKSDNFDIDLSNFKPTTNNLKIDKEDSRKITNEEVTNKLLPLKKREEVSAAIKYGKKDPFSSNESNNQKTFFSNLKLKGFISLSNVNHAFIEYSSKAGLINKNSIGGLNTELIPNGAKVIEIDPIKEIISLQFEDENYEIKLN